MTLEEIGKKIAQYGAPILGAAIAGPAGAIAAQAALKGLGIDSSDPIDIIKTLEAKPEEIAHLLQVESTNKVELERISVQRLSVQEGGMENARKYSIDKEDNTARNITYILMAGLFLIVGALFLDNTIPDGARESISMIIGFFINELEQAIKFHTG